MGTPLGPKYNIPYTHIPTWTLWDSPRDPAEGLLPFAEVPCTRTLTLIEGSIFEGIWAQSPYHIRVLGDFDA